MSITAPRKKVYPRHLVGTYHRRRNVSSTVLQSLLFLLPFLSWNGSQAVLFDLPNSRLVLFGQVIHPDETYFLHLMLLMGALTLFACTALAGRLWCGYACPQTLFTQSFLMIERLCEGDRAQRMRLDRHPATFENVARKLVKWTIWTGMALWLGVTLTGYFYPIRSLLAQRHLPPVALVFAALFLFQLGWFREQFCNYLCPYARFQGVMLDRDSLVVAYDAERGEPRGKVNAPARGSCIDCTMCVQVCPAGIDIRKGLQLECISCGACVDACDQAMERVSQPTGLVRYTSLNALEHRPARVIRPRVLVYLALLAILGTSFLALGGHRGTVGLEVTRAGSLWTPTPDGRITNAYQVHLVNHRARPCEVRLSVSGFPGSELVGPNPVPLSAGQILDASYIVLHPRTNLLVTQPLTLEARTDDGPAVSRTVPFIYTGGGI